MKSSKYAFFCITQNISNESRNLDNNPLTYQIDLQPRKRPSQVRKTFCRKNVHDYSSLNGDLFASLKFPKRGKKGIETAHNAQNFNNKDRLVQEVGVTGTLKIKSVCLSGHVPEIQAEVEVVKIKNPVVKFGYNKWFLSNKKSGVFPFRWIIGEIKKSFFQFFQKKIFDNFFELEI